VPRQKLGEFALNGEDLSDGHRFFVFFAGFQSRLSYKILTESIITR